MKDVYVIQPYKVGSKERNSLALIIPADLAKVYGVDTSTIFEARIKTGRLVIETTETTSE